MGRVKELFSPFFYLQKNKVAFVGERQPFAVEDLGGLAEIRIGERDGDDAAIMKPAFELHPVQSKPSSGPGFIHCLSSWYKAVYHCLIC